MANRLDGTVLRIALLAVLSVVAGLLTAGIALPLVGGVGLAARDAANSFNSLPTDLVVPPLQQHSVIKAADGSTIAVLRGPEDRIPVTITQVPPVMQQAIVSIEDSRFYQNNGIDLRGIVRAAFHNASGGPLQGASTITQQYVKNVLEQQQGASAAADTVTRKLQDARYAIALEHRLSKAQILDDYLNIAYFGESAYGIGAAAQRYFGESVSRLTLPQAALLAGIVEDPSRYDPIANPDQSVERRNTVIARMLQLGYLTAAQARSGEHARLELHVVQNSIDPCDGSSAPFFCRYVLNELLSDPQLGATQEERNERIFEGGLTIRTTLDPADEVAAQTAVDTEVPVTSPAAAPIVMVAPGSGDVLAMTENRTYGTVGADATDVVYADEQGQEEQFAQPGSSFKLFTLITALDQGLPISTAFNAPACLVIPNPPPGFGSAPVTPTCPRGGYQNSDPAEAGEYSMATGTWFSVNTYFIQLEEKVGLANVKATAEELGVPTDTVQDAGGSLTVGGLTYGVSPLVMAEAYATIAAGGLYCPARTITSISGPDHIMVPFSHPAGCQQLISQAVTNQITSILQGVIDVPGATAYATAHIGRPAAGKTGTNGDYRSAWFVGYTPQLATAVALAYPTGNASLSGLCVPSGCYAEVFGGGLPATMWALAMKAALANDPVVPFPVGLAAGSVPPPSKSPSPKASATASPSSSSSPAGEVPTVIGDTVGVATSALQSAGYQVSVVGAVADPSVPVGDVVDQSPAGGDKAPRGTTVNLLLSSGGPTTSPSSSPSGNPTPTVSPTASQSPARRRRG